MLSILKSSTALASLKADDANLDVEETRLEGQAADFSFTRRLARRAEADGNLVAQELPDGVSDGGVVNPAAAPDTQGNPAAIVKHPMHFPQRERLVREELQSLLTKDGVDAPVRQAEVQRASLDPFDGRSRSSRQGSGDCKHCGIQVQSDDCSGRAYALRGNPRDHAGSARDIKDPIARGEACRIDQGRCPGAEDVAHGVALVEFGRVAADLPLLGLIHFILQPSLTEMRRAASVTAPI